MHRFIYFPLARWDGEYSSTAFSIAKELAKNHEVFYLENPYTILDVFKKWKSLKGKRRALLFGKDNLTFHEDLGNFYTIVPLATIPINWLSKGKLYRLLLNVNEWLVFRSIRKILERPKLKEFIYFNSFNPFYKLNFKSFQPKLRIYQSVDRISSSRYISKHGSYLEVEMIKQSDFVVTTSTELKSNLQKISPKVYLVPNAADFALFSSKINSGNIPDDLAGFSKPVICYTGNICHRIDYELLQKVARFHHDKIILLIGPNNSPNNELQSLLENPNVLYLGKKKLQELPPYLHYSSCAIIPFIKNELTKSIYPLKINEYLATGTGVVSTDFSADISAFDEIAKVACTDEEFIQYIDEVIITDNDTLKSDRQKIAANNNWGDRCDQILGLIDDHLN